MWLYLDMNSYFASVEQEMNPHLRGKPVAVVPTLADTTCCIAVSYEGKVYGIQTGTKVSEAKKRCPEIQLIVGNHRNYIQYHQRIVETVESCLPVEEVCSIDEIACKLTGSHQNVEVAEALAMKIKAAIKRNVGSSLKCSIGVAPNRYLAKIAADMKKPDGFTVIRPADLPEILYQLKLRDLSGIGPQMESRLRKKGIHTLKQLCSLSPQEMGQAWGSVCGEEMWHLLRGAELKTKKSDQRSISHSHVLPPKLRHEKAVLAVLKKLTTKAALRLRKEGYWATGIQIFVRFLGYPAWKAGLNRITETQDTLSFIHVVSTLWKDLPRSSSIYAVGVALTGLVTQHHHIPSLFDDPKRERLMKTMDTVNEKFGKNAVHYGATHETDPLAPLRIAFTRIPDESEA